MSTQKGQANQPLGNRIPSGYEGSNIPTDFSIPAVGIADVDKAMFDLFNRDNQIYAFSRDDENSEQYEKKVPVVYATGERFALRERRNPIRDKNGALILPIISIRRTGLDQAKENMGSAIGQDTGDYVIKKRISKKDPQYKNLINKQGLKNQDNVASVSNFLNGTLEQGNLPNTVASRRDKFDQSDDDRLKIDLNNTIYEVITIPFPIRFMANYEVTIWSSYQEQMLQIIEKIMTNYDGQGRTYRLETDKGYWFVAYFDDNIESQDNSEDFTDDERVHKYVFNVKVPAFMLANKNGGDMVPFRRYLSSPQISFGLVDGLFETRPDTGARSGNPDDFVLDNIENLDAQGQPIKRLDDILKREIIVDPFSGEEEEAFVRVKRRNARAGETTISAKRLLDIEIP
jgi:hypothetical protein